MPSKDTYLSELKETYPKLFVTRSQEYNSDIFSEVTENVRTSLFYTTIRAW